MPSTVLQKHRSRVAVLVLVAGGAALCGCLGGSPADARGAADPGVLTYAAGGFRYEYQRATGRESLFEDCAGTRRFVDVSGEHREALAACRRALATRLGVEDLSSLRREDRDRDAVARLRAIGYL